MSVHHFITVNLFPHLSIDVQSCRCQTWFIYFSFQTEGKNFCDLSRVTYRDEAWSRETNKWVSECRCSVQTPDPGHTHAHAHSHSHSQITPKTELFSFSSWHFIEFFMNLFSLKIYLCFPKFPNLQFNRTLILSAPLLLLELLQLHNMTNDFDTGFLPTLSSLQTKHWETKWQISWTLFNNSSSL